MHPVRNDSRSDYYHTPNLERLAEQGMRFSRAYSPGPNCSPSRFSLLSGMCPGNPGENGYVEHDGSRGNVAGGGDKDPKYIFDETNKGIAFMRRQAKADKPFYLKVSHFAVHLPMQHRPETLIKYENKDKGRRHTNPEYAAMTEDLDVGVGMILDEIDTLGIADNTYVIYTSDNGALRGEDNKNTNNDPLNFGKPQVWVGGARSLIPKAAAIRRASRPPAETKRLLCPFNSRAATPMYAAPFKPLLPM